MWRKGLLGLVAVALAFAFAFAGCGGDGGGQDTTQREEEARQAVLDLIAAFQAGDYETACAVQDQRVNDSIISISKKDTCAEGYEQLFAEQGKFGTEPGSRPFDEFLKLLEDYEVGAATLEGEEGALSGQVALDGPEEVASLVVEEDGEIKVSELFVTPDANTNPGSFGQ